MLLSYTANTLYLSYNICKSDYNKVNRIFIFADFAIARNECAVCNLFVALTMAACDPTPAEAATFLLLCKQPVGYCQESIAQQGMMTNCLLLI